MKIIHSIPIIFVLLVLTACQKESDFALEEGAMYVSSVNDPNTQEPFHEVLVKHKDTLWKYNFWKNEKNFSKAKSNNLKEYDVLAFNDDDSFTFIPKFTLFENLVTFINKNQYLMFVKTSREFAIHKEDFSNLVENKVFETEIDQLKTPNSAFRIQEKVRFSTDEITYLWEYYYADKLMHSETETIPLSYFEVEGQLFIIPGKQENPYPIYQVVKADNEEIELAYFTDFEKKIKSYKSTKEADNSNYEAYAFCKDSFQSLYYVGEEVRYAKGMDHLLSYLQQDAPTTDGDGFINIHFTINCNGEVGRLGLELLNRSYQPTDFDPELIKHITDKVLLINNWDNLSQVNYRGAKDAKAFFLIQIANQQIVEVCP